MSYNTKQSQHERGIRFLSRGLLCGVSIVAAAVAMGQPSAAHAEDRYWDANRTAVGSGGTGTWDALSLNWSPSNDGVSGPYVTPWNDAALDNAIFGGTAGAVTLGAPIRVHNLTFNTAGYVLTGNTLTLGGTAPTITNGVAATINLVIAGSSGLTKAGAGALTLGGANTFSGGIYLNTGTINAASDAALGAAGNGIFTGAGATVGLSIGGANTNRTVTIGNGGLLNLGGAGVGSALITGSGRVSVGNGVTLSNDASTYTGTTRFNGINGVATAYFTSIGNLGEASSLGAPTTVDDGTITFAQSSQYSDNVIYIGDGDSSNRNWQLTGSTALIRNRGTGTLSITGNINTSGGSGFYAEDADFALLGVLSGGNYAFSAQSGRVITLAGANTFTGLASIAGLATASVLADSGTASSLGAGANTTLNVGTLSYTGTGNSSNRLWAINGANGILNNGSGALNLTGAATFGVGGAVDSLTLGGSFAGTNTYTGIISGAGSVISDGAGTWELGGVNTFTGTVIVNNGTLRAGTAAAFGNSTGYVVNGGTLDLGGFDLVAPSLTGTGGAVALGGNLLTVSAKTAQTYGGSISGSGGLTKEAAGTLTLTGASSYTGATTIGGGKLALDFSGPSSPADNIISGASTLILSGGRLDVIGAAGETNNQNFAGTTVTVGSNTVRAISGAGGATILDLGILTRTGGLANFVLSDADSSIMTDSADGVLGGWATVNGSDYAKIVGGSIVAFADTDYTNKDNAGTWATGDILSDTAGTADSPFFGTLVSGVQLGGLRYTAAAASIVSIADGQTLGVDGTIIVAPGTLATSQTIQGGSLTGGAGGGALGVQQNGQGTFTINSTIVNNGTGTSFVKGGDGTVRLGGANTFTGGTTLSGGKLEFSTLANGGAASGLGASTAASANLVLESGTLAYVGATDAVSDRGFTLVNGGAGNPSIEVASGRRIEFSGEVTSPDDAGLTKTGLGTLVLSNAANTYVGVTTVTGSGGGVYSTLSVNTLANGGVASGIGAAGSESANLILNDGGRLEYTGVTTGIDRGFSLNSGNGRIAVAEAGTTLAISGAAVGAGGLVKDGAGTLVLSGANTYTGETVVNEGTLRAGGVGVFGNDTGLMGVNSGATLNLGGFNVRVGALRDGALGGGSVVLGSSTLTVGGANGTFTGVISGAGRLTKTGGGVQVLSGCSNTYTGITTISGGTLSVDCLNNGGLASGIGASSSNANNLVLADGRLTYTGGSVSIDRGFTLQSGDGYVNVANAGTVLEFEGVVAGGGRFQKEGAGTLLLSGSNSYAGDTVITAGVLRAGSNTALGARGYSIANSAGTTLDLNGFSNTLGFLSGGGALGGNITLGAATLTLNWASGAASYGGAISGSGSLIKNGGVVQSLTGCGSSYTGSTTINGGVLAVTCLTDGGTVSSIGTSAAGAANLVINGGTLRYVGAGGSTNRQFTLGASGGNELDASGTGAIEFASTAALTFASPNTAQTLTLTGTNVDDNIFAGQITNNGTGVTRLTKTGAGTWNLTNPASTYTGVTTISGGILGVDKLADGGQASSLGASSAAAANLVIGSGSTLRYTGTGDTTNRLFTLSAGVTYIQSSGTGAVVFTDTGAVTLATPNQNRTIALGGSNTGNNTLAGSIGNAGTGVTTLAKNDSGTWVLTGNHTYTGTTNVNAGTLSIGAGGNTGSITSAIVNNDGALVFNRSDSLTYAGMITGAGSVRQAGAGSTILTGTNDYTGGTTISAGTLQLGNGGATGSIVGNVTNNGVLTFNRNNTYNFSGIVSGSGSLIQVGAGTTVLTAANSYSGGTTISAGTLQLGNGGSTGSIIGNVANAGSLAFNRSDEVTFAGLIAGAGSVVQSGSGTTILTGGNSYTGGTTISAGTLQIGNGGSTGGIFGDVANNGALVFNRMGTFTLLDDITGTGTVTQAGPGTTVLSGNNSYLGATNVNAGTLLVNGDQSGAPGLTSVASGATLGGSGTIGGDVFLDDGATLKPGENAGTLAIAGNLSLSAGSVLNFEFGEANVVGGTLNDLVEVGGNLVLDGTINVDVPTGGTFGGGIYRVFNYGGTLTNNGLELGDMPAASAVTLQTSVAGQVNLVNSVGLELSFWDGDGGPQFNNVVNGGSGTWHLGGTDNHWTGPDGSINAAYADGTFAIFAGTAGTVTVDNDSGIVTASGMQFASNGYVVTGDALTLTDAQSVIRVGDGTALGAGFTATIGTELTGAAQLVKTDLGTLVLAGTNSYSGGTLIDEGRLHISSNENLGELGTGITIKDGTLHATAGMTTGRAITLTGAATLSVQQGVALNVEGVIDGTGSLTKAGGLVILTGDNTYTGGTTISAGTLQIGAGGTTGSIIGNVVNNASLVFNRGDALTYAGAISGTGQLLQSGAGTTTLTGINSYTGSTTVLDGELRLENGGQITGGGALSIAESNNLNAVLTVDGIGSRLVAGATTLAQFGTGVLNIQNGAEVQLASLNIASNPPGNGTVNVRGSGSRLTVTSTGNLFISSTGTAALNILDGATMSYGGTANLGFSVGASGNGTAVVSGTGSQWTVANALNINSGSLSVVDGGVVTSGGAFTLTAAAAGTGTLTIASGGRVDVGSGVLALRAGTATLNIGGVAGAAATAAGTLGATSVTTGANSRVNFNHTDTAYQFGAAISGTGRVNQTGSGTTVLTGTNSYIGATTINAGALFVNGSQSAATGLTTVNSGAVLGGTGVIGGDVTLFDGAALNPGGLGTAPGALTINGNLALASGSALNVNLGQANIVGGPLNDLVNVGGNLTLDGTLNVETAAGGSFDPGIYRLINYGGSLNDNGLTVGTIPSPNFYVQTSVANQVNLVNTAGLAFRYWDGNGNRNDGIIDGGDGRWQNPTGNDNWVDDDSVPNAPFADSAFAVFMGAAGTVTVDDSLGGINVAGMQFLTDGYAIGGNAITLTGTQATIRVGDGTAAGASTTATIGSELAGTAQLVKSDLGTLILSGANSYTGGTAINGGILQITADANLGAAAGGVSFNGGTLQTTVDLALERAIDLIGSGSLLTDTGTTLDLTGLVSGAGGLTKDGAGTLILTGANSYAGGTTVNAGTLLVNGDQSAVTGLTGVASGATLGGTGVIGGDVAIADGATLSPGGADGLPGTLTVGGSLSLDAGSRLLMQFGEANTAGGALNDLIEVGGDLILDGTLTVTVPTGGEFGAGIYRVINYGGALTNNGLSLGTMPFGSTATIQTSITGQVNLVNTDGLMLNFWDGAAGPKFDGAISGGDGRWQNSTGNDNWTDAAGTVNAGYADGAVAIFAGTGGTVTIDNSLGQVSASGMQFAVDGYTIAGSTLDLTGPQVAIRVGDGSVAGAEMTAIIAAQLSGGAQLVKTDAGTLVLSGNNSYTGGTAIEGGTLAIATDANLGDVAGAVSIGGGTLQTTADLASDRGFSLIGAGTILTDQDTTFTLNGPLSGTGLLTKGGAGTLLLTGDNSGYTAATTVAGGTLAVDGVLGSTVTVASGGRLEGIGQVGYIANSGIVGPGRSIGTLTIAGDYVGNGGTLEIEAVLGADSSAADRLVVNGATSGNTQVSVLNREGIGGQTVDGIKIIDVTGASNGTFALNGDYLFQGEQAVVAGAYSYLLYQGGVATPTDGDWYLRSSLTDSLDPAVPAVPIYQPGVPIYEAYGANLQALNGLPTLQQRVGNRSWAAGANAEGTGIWGRMEGTRNRANATVSTSMSDQNVNSWKMQLGADRVLVGTDKGERLVAGVTAYYGGASSHVRSIFGNGSLKTDGYGVGATLTWYGIKGFYIDGQAQYSWYDSDLESGVLGNLARGNDGHGEALSLEVGKRTAIGGKLSITPQVQMAYSNVGFDRFADPAGAVVAADKGDSLKSRWGISLDRQAEWEGGRSHIYGLVNLSYEWLDGTRTRVSGTPIDYANERLWGELGLGASVSWSKGVTLYGEVSGNSPFRDFGDSYSLKGNAGVRIAF